MHQTPGLIGNWALLVLVALTWGTAFTFTGAAVEQVPPLTIAAGRIVIAAALLFGVMRVRGLRLPRGAGDWRWFLTLALLGNALPFFSISWGQERVDSGLAGILMAVMPLATLILAHFLVAGDRITPLKVASFVLGFGGIVVLTGPEALRELGGADSEVFRQLAVLGGALCYAGYAVAVPGAPRMPKLTLACGSLIAASLLMVPIALWFDRPWTLTPDVPALFAVGWLGVIATAFATLVYFRLMERTGPTFVALINFLVPVVALGAGIAVLGERPRANVWLALGLILSGLLLGERSRKQSAPPGDA